MYYVLCIIIIIKPTSTKPKVVKKVKQELQRNGTYSGGRA